VHLGAIAQTIEIADVRLLDYGPDINIDDLPYSKLDYEGRQADAAWRSDAQARIEQIRKGDLTVQTVRNDGTPVAGANVRVRMQRHAFVFGTAVNVMMLAGEETDFPVVRRRKNMPAVRCSWDDARKYRELVEKYFTRVTFEGALRPHVWKLETGSNQRYRRQYEVLTTKAVPWLQARNFSIRGHYIGWGAMDFPPLQKDFVGNPDGHREWLWKHMADILPNTDEYVSEWDTINHIVGWSKTYDSEYGGPQIHADIMREARRLAPSKIHAINEGQILPGGERRQPYQRVIGFLKEQDQEADVVGFMAHFGSSSLTPPADVLQIYDRFAKIAPRLQLTELDVDTDNDDQLQADYLRDLLIASFSHPNIHAIIQWGFWENQHWKPGAALWRSDWSLKPAGKVFVDLVSKRWWTDETTKSEADGTCQIRGFLGDYEVTVDHGGKTVTVTTQLDRDGTRVQVVIP
jgi:GH35 family endo-1,4-beta-xylanase